MLSTLTTLCLMIVAQGVQAWFYPTGYNYGFYQPTWYHNPGPAFGPSPYYHQPNPYFAHDLYHMYSTQKGAQIGAALGSLAANLGRKK